MLAAGGGEAGVCGALARETEKGEAGVATLEEGRVEGVEGVAG